MRNGLQLLISCLLGALIVEGADAASDIGEPVPPTPPTVVAASVADDEMGVWRSRTQQIFDPVERKLIRRNYIVWDSRPSRNLDFVWVPDVFADDKDGLLSGRGRLIWRFRGKPAYDPESVLRSIVATSKKAVQKDMGRTSTRAGSDMSVAGVTGLSMGRAGSPCLTRMNTSADSGRARPTGLDDTRMRLAKYLMARSSMAYAKDVERRDFPTVKITNRCGWLVRRLLDREPSVLLKSVRSLFQKRPMKSKFQWRW